MNDLSEIKKMSGRGGYALVIVLATLVLCALLLVILLDRGKLGLRSASAYSQAMQVRTLSDMAVHRVFAQIRDATTLNQRIDTPLNQRDTWASQPGALRVFSASGNLRSIYKLYSSDAMVTDNPDLEADLPDDWHSRPLEFTDLNAPTFSNGTARYPIVNPAAATSLPGATGIVDGFEIRDTVPLATGSNVNPAPMPVRWIYILRDGTHCQLGDPRIDQEANPIVGRIAFWTDDETTKVNLNTASPAGRDSFWDAPRAGSNQEINQMAWAQPSQNEYTRYPGHPAMVSLRPILGDLNGLDPSGYFDLSPYYRWGGSQNGTKRVDDEERVSLLFNKQDRAYASLDEFRFTNNPIGLRAVPTREQLENLGFFTTVSSRAPELNLFGQPRVSIWPVHATNSAQRRTPFDQLIAFNSTIGGKAYYFMREDPRSATHDYTEITRNRALYGYLQELTATPVPGFAGGDFLAKYAADRDQILTEIFDYIRITNLNETYGGRDENFKSYTTDWLGGSGQTASVLGADYLPDNPLRGAGLVVPIEIGNTRGMGRFPVIAEVGLWFVTHYAHKPTEEIPEPPRQLEAMFVIETITPAFGYMPWCGTETLEFELESSALEFAVEDRESKELFPPSILGDNKTRPALVYYPPLLRAGHTPGGYDGAAYIQGAGNNEVSGTALNKQPYPFFSVPYDLQEGDATFSVTGGNVQLRIRIEDQTVQTYTIAFPSITELPLPILSESDVTAGHAWTSQGRPWWGSPRAGNNFNCGPLDGDVLHGMELAHGDARLIAGMKAVPASLFTPHKNYGEPVRFAHGMRTVEIGRPTALWKGGTAGKYVDLPGYEVPIANDHSNRTGRMYTDLPKVPAEITHIFDPSKNWSGDFDNGWSQFANGPFINKPDEGMMHTSEGTHYITQPYHGFRWSVAEGLFSPLRQVPSAVMFGSLPTGVKAGIPWRTLLFCPNPADPDHPGFEAPADHLLLDLFRMPVVEPVALSGPASTDGKINLNYAIAPFSYIRRASSWYAVLESLKFFAVPDAQSDQYKGAAHNFDYRNAIDVEQTLRQFEQRFAEDAIFRSATEICSLFLVPAGATLETVSDLESGWWSTRQLTGDNSREKPYAELYPKLTTQSNTFRIHMRVQVLAPSDGAPANGGDFHPLAEYRGSRLIERYLDATDERFIGPGGVNPDTSNLNALYRFRTLESIPFY